MTIAYKEERYESPVRFGPNGAPVLADQPDLVRSVEKPAPPLPEPPSRRRKTEAPPVVREDTNSVLLDAAGRVFKAITERIAYHENEARKLREALKPYSEFAGEEPPTTNDDLAVLMKAMEQLKGEQR
jgi:hypothetical protein